MDDNQNLRDILIDVVERLENLEKSVKAIDEELDRWLGSRRLTRYWRVT